jgi:hypothetical protein
VQVFPLFSKFFDGIRNEEVQDDSTELNGTSGL